MQLHAHKQAPQSSLTIITKVCTFLSTWSWHWQYETIIHLYIRKGDRTKFLTFEIILQKVKIRQGNGETEWIWTFPFFWWGLWKLCAGLIEDIRLLWSTPHVRNTKLLGFKDEIVNVVLIQEGNHSQKLLSWRVKIMKVHLLDITRKVCAIYSMCDIWSLRGLALLISQDMSWPNIIGIYISANAFGIDFISQWHMTWGSRIRQLCFY